MKDNTMLPLLRRLSAFTSDPNGGNPAGVWIGSRLPEPVEMQRIAKAVGFSETAFLARRDDGIYETRYFSPEVEVSFCGHATIASGVLLGKLEGEGSYLLSTSVGQVPVQVTRGDHGFEASLTSVATQHRTPSESLLTTVLELLGWHREDLESAIPPALAFAGAWHLVLAVARPARLDPLLYDFGRMKHVMIKENLTTLQLVFQEDSRLYHARNPFPVGGVVEDPATGAAAAALGGYLRDARLERTPFDFTIRQGEAMGRPSLIRVHVPVKGGVVVSGNAVSIQD